MRRGDGGLPETGDEGAEFFAVPHRLVDNDAGVAETPRSARSSKYQPKRCEAVKIKLGETRESLFGRIAGDQPRDNDAARVKPAGQFRGRFKISIQQTQHETRIARPHPGAPALGVDRPDGTPGLIAHGPPAR